MIRTRALAATALWFAAAIATATAAPVPAFLSALSPEKEVTAIVHIRGQADLSQVAGHPGRVVEALQAFSSAAQAEVMGYLAKRKTSSVKPLWGANVVIVTASRRVLEEIAQLGSVEEISENTIIPLSKERARDVTPAAGEIAWGVKNVKADEVWSNFGIDGTGVLVGHIDTGVDGNHPDLKGKVVKFKDFVKRDNTAIIDGQGHGTHTAGSILGGSAQGQRIGVAPGAKMVTARVFTAQGASTAVLLESMQWMMDPDGDPSTNDVPRVCSNSWGSNDTTDRSFYQIIDNWRAANIFPCFAAGNAGPRAKTVGIPGGYLNVLAVAALDAQNKIAYFSSRGPVKWDGKDYIKPDVAAPGHNVVSAKDGGGYTSMSGTSMACPHVSGVIALLYAAKSDLKIDEVIALLESTATDLGEPGKDNDHGKGLVNAQVAVGMTRASRISGKVTDSDGKPLAAKVDYAGPGGNGSIQAATDGTFSLALPRGDYKLTFSLFGYRTVEATVTVGDGNTELAQVLPSLPRGTVKGRILGAAGQPVQASIAVLDAPTAALGSDPGTGAYSLTLPAGTYKLKVTARGYKIVKLEVTITAGSTTTRDFALDAALPFLLVDDDGGANLERFYTSLLSDGVFTYHEVQRDGAIDDVDELSPYLGVIWFTGDRSTAFTSVQQTVVSAYLKAGGRLFLTGQNIARGLSGSAFLREVLQSSLVEDSMALRYAVRGIAGDPISSGIEAFGLNGPVPQASPDALAAAGPKAAPVLQYNSILGKRYAGIRVDAGAYRVAFLGFGLEGVAGDAVRGALAQGILRWLKPAASELRSRLQALPAGERAAFADQAARLHGLGTDDPDTVALRQLIEASRNVRRTLNFR